MCNEVSCQTPHERLIGGAVRDECYPLVFMFGMSGLLRDHSRVYETFYSHAKVQHITHRVRPLYEWSDGVLVIVRFPRDDSSFPHRILQSFAQRKKLAYASYKRMAKKSLADDLSFLFR